MAAALSRVSIIRALILALVGFTLLAMLGMTFLQRKILFPREFTQPDPGAGAGVPGLERVWIQSTEGPVEGWFLPGREVSARNPGPAVLFAHGNAELIDYWPQQLSPFRQMGVSVLLAEYRGYGRSAGSPSQKAITQDFAGFYDLLRRRPDVDPARIVFSGRSLGGGAVCALAAERKPAALLLQSTFVSVVEMGQRFLMPGFLIADPFDNLAVVSRLDVPILIVHGRRDNLIPYRHAERLHQAARGSELIAYDCDHNDCPPDWSVYWRDIERFLTKAQILPPH